MSSLKLYDPQSVVVTFGVFELKGFAEGSMIEVERNEDSFALTVGVDGEGTRTRSANKSGKATIHLGQTSESNAVLSALLTADELAANGVSIMPLMIKDTSGNSLCFAAKAWVTKPPKSVYESKPTARDWVIEANSITIVEGGN